MLRRLKLGAKSEIENMCVAFRCLTAHSSGVWKVSKQAWTCGLMDGQVAELGCGSPGGHLNDNVQNKWGTRASWIC
jgi:hypothetical protein